MSCKNDSRFAVPVANDSDTDPDALATEQAASIIAEMKALYQKLLSLPEAGFALAKMANERLPLTALGEREGEASTAAHKYLPGIADCGPAESRGQWLTRECTARYALRVAEVAVRDADSPENHAMIFLLSAALACDEIQVDGPGE